MCKVPASTLGVDSSHFRQLQAQLVGGAEKRVFHRVLRSAQDGGHGLQLETLVMSQFEYHALAGRELVERPQNALAQLAIQGSTFRTGARPLVGGAIQNRLLPLLVVAGIRLAISIAVVQLLAAQVIAAQVGDDALDPGIERALEAESSDIAVSAQKCFLINILRIFGRVRQVGSQPQDGAIVVSNKCFEGGSIALLRTTHQPGVIDARGRGGGRQIARHRESHGPTTRTFA